MATEHHLFLVLLLLVLPVAVRGHVKKTVHTDVGKPLILECMPHDPMKNLFKFWTISDGTKNTINEHAQSVELMKNGWILHIPDFTKAHYGDYTCNYLNATGALWSQDFQVLDKPPSTFERYRLSIIIGLVAAAAALVVMGVICALYNFRWEARHGATDAKHLVREYDYTQEGASSKAGVPGYYTNEGYNIDDVTLKNTKL